MNEDDCLKELIEIRDIVRDTPVRIYDDEIIRKLNEIEEKIDNLNIDNNRPESLPDSPVKIKRKKEVVNLLLKHKKLTATQLSYLTKISRTRCNEYLREMENGGMLKGNLVDKKKYYSLI